ncbi:MAG: hypothetical protein ACUVQ0_01305 [Thermoproteota archaeon]
MTVELNILIKKSVDPGKPDIVTKKILSVLQGCDQAVISAQGFNLWELIETIRFLYSKNMQKTIIVYSSDEEIPEECFDRVVVV